MDWLDIYCQRGEMENRIKEQQLGLFADRTNCHAFLANQFRLFLSSSAYVLMEALRRLELAGTKLARAQVQTVRLKLFRIAARVISDTQISQKEKVLVVDHTGEDVGTSSGISLGQ